MDVRRSMPFQRNRRYLYDRTVEAVGNLWTLHLPHKSPKTARNVRVYRLFAVARISVKVPVGNAFSSLVRLIAK